jgi:hypothetical protein
MAPCCSHTGCAVPPVCAPALAIFPPRAVMEFHKTDQFLNRLIFGLRLCDEHARELEAAGPFALMKREDVEAIARMCGRAARVAVDVDGTKIIRVALDDPELLIMDKLRKQNQEEKAQ